MTIAEMNMAIDTMRECYKFDDEHTNIKIGHNMNGIYNEVMIQTTDANGTYIEMRKKTESEIPV